MPRASEQRKLSRWEVLGAWLHVWTPPRDVEVPPIPWRAVGVGAVVLAVLAVLVVTVGIPAVQDENRSTAEREQAASDARIAARLRRLEAEQQPHRAQAAPAADVAERRALVGRLEAAIGDDARARVRAGDLRGTIRRVDCQPGARSGAGGVKPEELLERTRAGYECTAVTSDIAGHEGAAVGYPFKGVIDFRTGALVWCKTNPPPGEQVVPDPSKVPKFPAVCGDPGAG
jgi:hypothetical protein